MKLKIADNVYFNIYKSRYSVIEGDKFSLRKVSSIFADGRYWVYGDVISYNNRYWPNSYDSDIGLFSSSDCKEWKYHGIVVEHRDNDFKFDFGAASTPHATIFKEKIYLFYSGKEQIDGSGKRHILLARANSPAGEFIKHPYPIVQSFADHIHFDDPVACLSEDGKQIELYYRYANHKEKFYEILKIVSNDGIDWSTPIKVLKSDTKIRAYETVYGYRLKNKDKSHFLLFTFDHFATGQFKTAIRISDDGISFTENEVVYFDDYWRYSVPACGFQLMFLSKYANKIEYISIPSVINENKRWMTNIYRAELEIK